MSAINGLGPTIHSSWKLEAPSLNEDSLTCIFKLFSYNELKLPSQVNKKWRQIILKEIFNRLDEDRLQCKVKDEKKLSEIYENLPNIPNLSIKGFCTPSVGKFTNLSHLYIKNTNKIEPILINLPARLRSLHLEVYIIDLKSLSALTNLSHLSLPECYRISRINENFTGLSHLEKLHSLNLSGCRINTLSLKSITTLTNLSALNLEGCTIENEGYIMLTHFEKLRSLDLSYSDINSLGLKSLSTLTNLSSLNLEDCSKIKDEGDFTFAHFEKLRSLNLNYCTIADKDFKSLSTLTNLSELLLNRTFAADEGIKALSLLTNLSKLSFAGCQHITDQRIKGISLLTNLSHLSLSKCELISDEGLNTLLPLSKLTVLDLKLNYNYTDQAILNLAQKINFSELRIFEDTYPFYSLEELTKYLNVTNN